MTRKLLEKCLLVLGVTLGLGTSGLASAYECTGTIDWVSLNPEGTVTVSSQSSGLAVFYVCQIDSTQNGVSPNICNAMLATLLSAKATGAQVTWGFSDSVGCNRATFNGGNWYWLGGAPSSWYYGPQAQ